MPSASSRKEMHVTMQRSAQQLFKVDRSVVVENVRHVLEQDSNYRGVAMLEGGDYEAHIKPSFVTLPTKMVILTKDVGSGTNVTVTVSSQPFVLGDAFGMYDRFIQDFLSRLCGQIAQDHASRAVCGELKYTSKITLAEIAGILLSTLAIIVLVLLFSPFDIGSGTPMLKYIAALFVLMCGLLYVINLMRVVHVLVRNHAEE